jgi:heme exporter protein A
MAHTPAPKHQQPAPSTPAIEINGLSKAYGRAAVLRDLDLNLAWGEVLTLLGPNGSGKTTLVKILAGLARPDSGRVRVAGLDQARAGQHVRRLIGVVTHEPLLYDDLTAYENLRLVTRMFRLDEAEERIARVAERLGVASRLRQRVGTLSHGLRKRFTIARALVHDPAVLLMDEPESGLDVEAQGLLDAVIRDRSGSVGAILMTTHSLERAFAVGDRLAILSGGGIVYDGAVDTVAGVDSVREIYASRTKAAQ